MISYEFPLSERIRTLLRLEDLYNRVRYFTAKEDADEHHIALLCLFEILEVTSRGADLKSDLLLELERQKQVLESLRENPEVSQDALDNVLWEIDRSSGRLLQAAGKFGQELRANEWLMNIKQRTDIRGGTCEFDLPSYHYWLHQSVEQRRHDLEQWFMPFMPVRDGITIVLRLLRESGKISNQVAGHGVYQQMMAGRMAQMLRVRLRTEYLCVPEVSANKYALNVRFVTQEVTQRPKPIETDVEFELTFCNL